MNLKKVEKDFPKAYKLFIRSKYSLNYNDRNLFDFFDDNGIYIGVYFDVDTREKKIYFYYKIFSIKILNITPKLIILGQEYLSYKYSRKQAEEKSLLKAFEILEAKL